MAKKGPDIAGYDSLLQAIPTWLKGHPASLAGPEKLKVHVLFSGLVVSKEEIVCLCDLQDEWIQHIC